jgi:hypothetical protein
MDSIAENMPKIYIEAHASGDTGYIVPIQTGHF